MVLPLYLAQTPLEMAGNPPAARPAWMACHFSPGGQGLSNLPDTLPEGTMLILDDSTPMDGHNPRRILTQLSAVISRLGCESLLLDFQRPELPGQQELAALLSSALPCPVAVSEDYARELSSPVFLPPVPPDRLLSDHIAPWKGREIWLEAALDGITLCLSESGCSTGPLLDFPREGLADAHLHCHYTVETEDNSVSFRLWRTRSDLDQLLSAAETQGIAKAIGLWQELSQQRCEEP